MASDESTADKKNSKVLSYVSCVFSAISAIQAIQVIANPQSHSALATSLWLLAFATSFAITNLEKQRAGFTMQKIALAIAFIANLAAAGNL
ncbi:hypothetical protein EBS02_09705 [bacterium]|nr:hypothetical protein [bacterium]NBX66836.1 hypothetical protein [Pseudomonadota bacterium]